MNKKIWTIALIAILSTTVSAGITSANTINTTKLNSANVKMIDLENINNITDWKELDDANFTEYAPTLKEIKEYLPKEIAEYKKAAKTDAVKKKLDELLSKLSKITKLEDAQKLEEELFKLFENEKNFDYDKLSNINSEIEFKEDIKDIKKYFKEELDTYKKIAKSSSVTKKIDEIKSKLAKTTKVEEAYKLQDEFWKLFDENADKNFDYDKLEEIQNKQQFKDLEKELNKNYKKSDKADLQKKLAKLKAQSKEIAKIQKKINAYYNDLNNIQMKIYPDMMINFEDCATWNCWNNTFVWNYENGVFQVTDNKKAIELAKTLKKDDVKTTLDKYFDKNSIKDKTAKIKFVEEVMSYYAVMSNWEAHEIYLALETYLENLKK